MGECSYPEINCGGLSDVCDVAVFCCDVYYDFEGCYCNIVSDGIPQCCYDRDPMTHELINCVGPGDVPPPPTDDPPVEFTCQSGQLHCDMNSEEWCCANLDDTCTWDSSTTSGSCCASNGVTCYPPESSSSSQDDDSGGPFISNFAIFLWLVIIAIVIGIVCIVYQIIKCCCCSAKSAEKRAAGDAQQPQQQPPQHPQSQHINAGEIANSQPTAPPAAVVMSVLHEPKHQC
jgi:hypothetical protein